MKHLLILIIFLARINSYSQSAQDYLKSGSTKFNAEDYKGAIQDFNKAIELDPKNDKAYCARGHSKSMLQDDRGAIQDYTKAVGFNPKYSDAYYERGRSKGRLEDYNGAIQDYTKTIELNPKHADAYFYRGSAKSLLSYKTNVNDLEGICLDFSKAGELGNADAYESIRVICSGVEDEEWYNQAQDKVKSKDYKGAIQDYTTAISLYPKNAKAFYRRGLCKSLLDDKEGACLDWKKAIELGSTEVTDLVSKYCK